MRAPPAAAAGFLALLALGAALPAAEGDAPVEPGFSSLFDGRNIERHFEVKGDRNSWTAVDGAILAHTGGDRLMSRERYGDFVLRLEWKVSREGNSGVFLRVPSAGDGAPWETGFEVQISSAHRDDAHCTGSLYGVEPVKPRPSEEAEVWHSFEITCLGKRITVKADGVICIDATAERNEAMARRPLEGHIGLQDSHAGKGSTIQYRNIRIQRLSPDGTIPGFKLLSGGPEGWSRIRTGHGTGGRWALEEGVWVGEQDPPGSGNGGVNATEARFEDFEVVLEARPDWGCDSGVFLRSTDSGQCYQILVDHYGGGNVGGIYGEGTGAFSNRNYSFRADGSIEAQPPQDGVLPLPFDARAWERHWRRDGFNELRGRIQGNPPRIDVWLNGVHLTRFQDDKKRLEGPGRLGLQVHGGKGWPAGARVRYRNIQVRELKPETAGAQ